MSSTPKLNDTNTSDERENAIRSQKQLLRKEIRNTLKLLSNDTIHEQSRQVWDQLHAMNIYQQSKSIGIFLSMPTNEIQTEYAVQHALSQKKKIYIPQVGKNFELSDMELIQINTTTATATASSEPIYANWPKNKWNIPEPPMDQIIDIAKPGDIDVIIVPGLAFDRFGNRLGQGKGYYDRFIQRMMNLPATTNNCSGSSTSNDDDRLEATATAKQKPPVLIAVALQCQFINNPLINEGDDSTASNDCDNNNNNDRKIPTTEHDYPMDYIILPNQIIEINKK